MHVVVLDNEEMKWLGRINGISPSAGVLNKARELPSLGTPAAQLMIKINEASFGIHRFPAFATGAEIKGLPIGYDTTEHDLFLKSGQEPDQLVADDDLLELTDGMEFMTAPRHINAG